MNGANENYSGNLSLASELQLCFTQLCGDTRLREDLLRPGYQEEKIKCLQLVLKRDKKNILRAQLPRSQQGNNIYQESAQWLLPR